MFLESFKITGLATLQIFLLGALGYFLMKKGVLKDDSLATLSRLVVEITLPLLIFGQLIKDFSFSLYPKWWVFPVLSLVITAAGLLAGLFFSIWIKGERFKTQFVSLVAFQNSGYLPLALVSTILPKEQVPDMLVYLFLFLLGFNLIIWSFGVYMLSTQENKKFELGSLFSPPVIAIISSLVLVFLKVNTLIPEAVLKPIHMIGECTVPLAMLVVGGSLALIRLEQVDKTAIGLLVIVKLILLPLVGLFLVLKFNLPELIGLLIVMQLAVPPATSLAVITKHYKKEDLLISQGIFFGHIFSLVTLPLFLSLYFALIMVK
jgi:hypothetical protein